MFLGPELNRDLSVVFKSGTNLDVERFTNRARKIRTVRCVQVTFIEHGDVSFYWN